MSTLAFPTDRALVAEFVVQHLEALRDYFLSGDGYRASGEEFRDQAVRFIERYFVRPHEMEHRVAFQRLRVPPEMARQLQRALDAHQQLQDRAYSARVWNGERTTGPSPLGRGTVNLRKEDTVAWNAWYNRLRYAEMAHTATPRLEVLEACDPLDGHVVSFEASDLEPPLDEGTGNQLAATEERFLRRHAQQASSAIAHSTWLDHLKCRLLANMQRFETRWRWQHDDPTADDACMAVAKPRVQLCLRAALALPQRYRNRTIRWTTLDLLLDRISPCFTPGYAEALVDAVFKADPSYQARIERLAAKKGCLGRRKAFPDKGIEPLSLSASLRASTASRVVAISPQPARAPLATQHADIGEGPKQGQEQGTAERPDGRRRLSQPTSWGTLAGTDTPSCTEPLPSHP